MAEATVLRLLRKTRGGFFETPALALEFEQMAVMQRAVEERRHDDRIASKRAQSSSGRLQVTSVDALS
ncbi:MAG: hypothetical protein IPP90_21235 [Gemmatimonadaceae bacterium]|nr:hypothetical protein [Gemmatimonadaceae bacterium]